MIVLTWSALLYAALTSLCLSLNRHHRDVFNGRATRLSQRTLCWLGFIGVGASLVCCLLPAPGGSSWVMWFCALTGLGYVLNFGLAYIPRLVPGVGKVALGGALIAAVMVARSFYAQM